MANIGVHVHIEGLNDIDRKMRRLGTTFSKRKYLDMIGIMLLGWSAELFKTEGKAPGRILRWRKLKPSTIKRRRGGSRKILQDTGRLRASFVYKVHHSAQLVAMGTADKRAQWLHHGVKPHLPARPLIPAIVNGRDMALKVLDDYVKRSLKRAGLD